MNEIKDIVLMENECSHNGNNRVYSEECILDIHEQLDKMESLIITHGDSEFDPELKNIKPDDILGYVSNFKIAKNKSGNIDLKGSVLLYDSIHVDKQHFKSIGVRTYECKGKIKIATFDLLLNTRK